MHISGVTELKASLSETLSRVKAGEEVLITEHGRPIARIVPLSSASPEASTDELVRAGTLRAPERSGWKGFWSLPRPEVPKSSALQALLDERRDGR